MRKFQNVFFERHDEFAKGVKSIKDQQGQQHHIKELRPSLFLQDVKNSGNIAYYPHKGKEK